MLHHDDLQKCLAATGADGVMSAEGNLYDPTIFARPPPVGKEGREYWRGRDGRGGFRVDAVFRRYMDTIYKYVLEQSPPDRKPLFIPSDPDVDATSTTTTTSSYSNSHSVAVPSDTKEPPTKKQKQDKKQPKPTSPNLRAMQPHLFHLLRPLITKHTNIRDSLAKARTGDIPAFENILQMTEAAVKEGLLEYRSNPENYEDDSNHSLYTTTAKTSREGEEKVEEREEEKEESSLATVKACKRPYWICQPYVRPLPSEALEKGSLTMSKREEEEEQQQRQQQQRKKKKKSTADSDRIVQDAQVRRTLPDPQTQTQTQTQTLSEREEMDLRDGDGVVSELEVPKEAMVCG